MQVSQKAPNWLSNLPWTSGKPLEIIDDFPARTGVDAAAIRPYFPPAFGIHPGSAGAFC
jgi:hypothetical protein